MKTLFSPEHSDRDYGRLACIIQEIHDSSGKKDETIRRNIPDIMRLAGRTLLGLRSSEPRFRESDWHWLSGVSPGDLTMQDANAFLCACILEFRSGKTDVWDNAAYLVTEILDNPENLWQAIVSHSPKGWEDQFWEYDLHPDKAVYLRLREIACLMIRYYHGDARQIWCDYLDHPLEVFKRLKVLGVPRSTACLVIGALKDEGYLEGAFDIVGDVVDSRVLGRIACGEGSGLSSYQARILGRMISPQDPWILDRPLYVLGMSCCAPGPRCRVCPARQGCLYAISGDIGVHIGSSLYEELFGQKTEQKSLKKWLNDG
jgi:hypothetical protein